MASKDEMFDLTDVPECYHPIFEKILPAFIERFITKSVDYDDTYKHLGSKGQFSDISRKYWKLKREVWEGIELQGEPVGEVIDDMLAHLLLLKLCQQEGI